MSAKQNTNKASHMPEFLRKFFVALKRKPSTIALVVLFIAFLYYSLNLTQISNTTAKIQGPGMGLCGFATMLFSMLMFGVIIFCDVHYMGLIDAARFRAENPIVIDAGTLYIANAYNMLYNHIIILGVGIALTLLLLTPVYNKLLGLINTSYTVEDYGKLQEIDISGED